MKVGDSSSKKSLLDLRKEGPTFCETAKKITRWTDGFRGLLETKRDARSRDASTQAESGTSPPDEPATSIRESAILEQEDRDVSAGRGRGGSRGKKTRIIENRLDIIDDENPDREDDEDSSPNDSSQGAGRGSGFLEFEVEEGGELKPLEPDISASRPKSAAHVYL